MKTVIILLVCLPFLFAKIVNEEALEVYRRMAVLAGGGGGSVNGDDSANGISHWFATHGMQLSYASCIIFCDATTIPETMGISAALCDAACTLLDNIGKK